MQRLRHNLPEDWLPGRDCTQRLSYIARGCTTRRKLVLVGADPRTPMLVTPAKGAQLVITHHDMRMTRGLGFDADTLIERTVVTDVTVEVFCEGVVAVDKATAFGLEITPADYVILSLWETPGRLGQSVTVHIALVSYCPATRQWLPLCWDEDSFWSVSVAPSAWDYLNLCTVPPFEELIAALRGAPAA